jgi:hypothetical protein
VVFSSCQNASQHTAQDPKLVACEVLRLAGRSPQDDVARAHAALKRDGHPRCVLPQSQRDDVCIAPDFSRGLRVFDFFGSPVGTTSCSLRRYVAPTELQ